MSKIRKNRGFTLAEVLIVAALVVVLSGVAFIAVWNHLRSMAQLERDTIAKVIYVAAQNHLTTAKSQGYFSLETSEYGMPGTSEEDQDPKSGKIVSYYLIAPSDSDRYQSVFGLMLPFGAVDETVLAGGTYVIRYQPTTASILDVFYSTNSGRFALTSGFSDDDYDKLMSDYYGEGNKNARRSYEDSDAVIGWYGGENAVAVGERLNVPSIEIINAERLQVKVTDNNSGITYASLKLIIEGVESTAKKAFALSVGEDDRVSKSGTTYTITLDEITNSSSGFHFCELEADTADKPFKPGENIRVYAVSYSNSALTNIARSIESTTNSLFGYDPKADPETAQISNIRHLENLDYRISHVAVEAGSKKKAEQTTDLIWKKKDSVDSGLNPDGFVDIAGRGTGLNAGIIQIHPVEGGTISENCFFPVCAGISESAHFIEYDGNNHSISNVTVNYSGDAGIFGTLNGSSVSNLLVLDSTMTSSSSSGNAGGLIGSMSGTTVEQCAANSTVSSGSGAAGGLIGSASGSSSITACYSGGHTDGTNASYYTGGTVQYGSDGKPLNGIYNVEAASGTAGGLIGAAEDTTVDYCYSTCSAKGTTAGGFVGNARAAVSVSHSYATGLVSGTSAEGAFAGSYTGNASDCLYYEIINERKDGQKGFTYVAPVGGKESFTGIAALDATAQTYNDFSLPSDDASYAWQPAVPIDTALQMYYMDEDGEAVYNLKTVAQLGAALEVDNDGNVISIVNTHYGDWPAPEIFVINSSSNG